EGQRRRRARASPLGAEGHPDHRSLGDERMSPSGPLPDGFVVALSRHTRVVDDGDVLVGGSPTRVARLKPAARALLHDGRVVVSDARSRALARHLLATGLADPVVSELSPV